MVKQQFAGLCPEKNYMNHSGSQDAWWWEWDFVPNLQDPWSPQAVAPSSRDVTEVTASYKSICNPGHVAIIPGWSGSWGHTIMLREGRLHLLGSTIAGVDDAEPPLAAGWWCGESSKCDEKWCSFQWAMIHHHDWLLLVPFVQDRGLAQLVHQWIEGLKGAASWNSWIYTTAVPMPCSQLGLSTVYDPGRIVSLLMANWTVGWCSRYHHFWTNPHTHAS